MVACGNCYLTRCTSMSCSAAIRGCLAAGVPQKSTRVSNPETMGEDVAWIILGRTNGTARKLKLQVNTISGDAVEWAPP